MRGQVCGVQPLQHVLRRCAHVVERRAQSGERPPPKAACGRLLWRLLRVCWLAAQLLLLLTLLLLLLLTLVSCSAATLTAVASLIALLLLSLLLPLTRSPASLLPCST